MVSDCCLYMYYKFKLLKYVHAQSQVFELVDMNILIYVNKVFPSFSFFLEFMIMFSFKSVRKRKNEAHLFKEPVWCTSIFRLIEIYFDYFARNCPQIAKSGAHTQEIRKSDNYTTFLNFSQGAFTRTQTDTETDKIWLV